LPNPPLPVDENSRLAALYELELLDTPQEERFDRITQLAINVFDVAFASIVLIDRDRQWAKSSSYAGQWQGPRNESICAYTILNDDILVIEDTRRESNVANLPCVAGDPAMLFYAGIALKSDNGSNVATLCIADTKVRSLSRREHETLKQLAKIVEAKLRTSNLIKIASQLVESENKVRLMAKTLRENERLSLLRNKSLELVAKGKPLRAVLHAIVTGVEQQFEQMMCSVLLLNEDKTGFSDGVAPSLPDFYNQAINTVIIGDEVGSCGTAAYTGKRVIVEDIQTHPYWAGFKALAEQAGLGACWSEPIISASGKVLGTFAIYHKEASSPSELEIRLISQSANLASIAIERESSDRLIRHQANYDSLTGLPNRQLCQEHVLHSISQARRNKQVFALLFLDLDRFKEVNDTLGHAKGDLLLVECAKRLRACLRDSDSVSRLGGDEFVVLLNSINDSSDVDFVANKIMKELARPFQLELDTAYISASVGVTLFPDDGEDYDTLLNNADQAMYRAKAQGRDCYQYFNLKMRDNTVDRINLANDLRHAIDRQELFVLYQPIINLQTGRVEKAEALLRWNHPTKGLIAPLDFIPIAEDTGLIFPIGEWVIEQALAQAIQISEQLGFEFKISVNTSPTQYLDSNRKNEGWIKLLTAERTNQSSITLEITENILMGTQDQVIDKLSLFRQCGIDVAIDDFGAGYSSMAYLTKYKIDILKIDQQFVQNMALGNDDFILCETMVTMAKKLGIEVVAEGIETAQQHLLIKQMGCDFGQGYYIARPIEPPALIAFIEAAHRDITV